MDNYWKCIYFKVPLEEKVELMMSWSLQEIDWWWGDIGMVNCLACIVSP